MINLSLCTISFRHQLISIEQIAEWASTHRFQAIELWGIHARNLAIQSQYDGDWLGSFGLYVSMISDYLPLDGDVRSAEDKTKLLIERCRHWRVSKLRSFAGQLASHDLDHYRRGEMVKRLRELCALVHEAGIELLIETHPNTLADTADSTRRLLGEVDHPALKLNFDVLHLWEAGDDPLASYHDLEQYIGHLHLKNIVSREQLPVFAPANVYSPAGTREGMVSLFDGAFDYSSFLTSIASEKNIDASLEWFGGDIQDVLRQDREQIFQLGQLIKAKGKPKVARAPVILS